MNITFGARLCTVITCHYILHNYAVVRGNRRARLSFTRQFAEIFRRRSERCADAICASDMNGQGRKNKTHDVLPCRLRNVPAANKNGRAETARSQLFRSDIIYVYIHTSQDIYNKKFFFYNTFIHDNQSL